MSIEKETLKIVDEMLPNVAHANKKTVTNELKSFVKELNVITEGKTKPLDFSALSATARENNIAEEYAVAASNHFLIDLGVLDEQGNRVVVPAFKPAGQHIGIPGTQLIINQDGVVLSAHDRDNPAVPEEYGHRHSYPFLKLAETAAVRVMHGDVDPTKDAGYKALTEMKIAADVLDKGSRPHIGHSVVHGKDGETMLGGTTGRTASPELIAAIRKYRPDLKKRLLEPNKNHPDNLAGLLDTISGEIASGVLVGVINTGLSSFERVIVQLPDPNFPEHKDVDWN